MALARRSVLWRALVAVAGGYAVANVLPVLLVAGLRLDRVDAALVAMQLSFLVYAGAVMWVFAAGRTASARVARDARAGRELPGFRQSMAGLHTWLGVLVGWLLYFMFITGTVGYLDTEIDRWMRPELPMAAVSPSPETPMPTRVRLASSAPVASAGMRPCTALEPHARLRE